MPGRQGGPGGQRVELGKGGWSARTNDVNKKYLGNDGTGSRKPVNLRKYIWHTEVQDACMAHAVVWRMLLRKKEALRCQHYTIYKAPYPITGQIPI